jgi:hypothetical protein
MAKDKTVVGITGKPIPKPRTAKQQYELEKKRRMEKHLGKNVGGTQYRSDVNPYYNPRARTFEEFMGICEAKVPVTRQAGDFRYSGRTGEEKAERRAKVLSNSPDAKKRRQANTIRSKIKTVADRDTAQASSAARQELYKSQQRRANELARQLMNKEETEIDEAKVDAGLSVAQKREVRTARSGLTGTHADYERRGAHRTADERKKDLADIRKGKKKDSSHFSYLP